MNLTLTATITAKAPQNGMTSINRRDTLEIQHQQHRSRACRTSNIDLESFPQETLLKKLASLFDRITSSNDRLNHARRRPATPSSVLMQPARRRRRGRTRTENCAERNDVDETDEEEEEGGADDDDDDDEQERRALEPRPSQSPTVIHFQNLSHRLYSSLDEPSCSASQFANRKNQLTTASLELLAKPSSILTFHAKIVPQISIEAYLLRILKYCPTSNGVFLSTLIYLDRLCTFYHRHHRPPRPTTSPATAECIRLDNSAANKKKKKRWDGPPASDLGHLSFHFVIDSWNVHRFLIASITAASKLLSDVFYTNSRYAKVGGLPLEELEELEIKFLLMSDFRLMISASEFDDYTERLLGRRPTASRPTTTYASLSSSGDDEAEEGCGDAPSDEETDREEDLVRRPPAVVALSHGDFLPNDSCASSVSSCNSSERSSCSTITPHSPPIIPSPPAPTPATPRSAFVIAAPNPVSPSI